MQYRQNMLLIQTNAHTPELLTPATSIDFQSCNRLHQIQNRSGNAFHQPNIQKQRRFLTKEEVFNHETIQLHSDDFSNSPSFLKMSVENTPLLFKFDSKGNPISESRQSIGQQSNFVQRFSKILQNNIDYENIPTTIKRQVEDPPKSISVTPNWQDRKINSENKQNTQRLQNKQKGRSINMNIYEMDNLIKIVDNMYEKAVDKKIECNVNIELTNKYLKNKTVFGSLESSDHEREVKDQRGKQGLTERYSQLQNMIKNIPEISQVKTRRQSNKSEGETNKVFISIEQLKNIQNNYQQLYKTKKNCDYDYSNLIKDENEDKKLTFTKRISIDILPEDQNEYKCKQVPDGPEICDYQIPQVRAHEKKEQVVVKKGIQILSHAHTKSQFEQLKMYGYESNENSCRLFKSRQQKREAKSPIIDNSSEKRSKRSERSENKKKSQVLVHYTVSKFNQIINSKPSQNSSIKSSQSSLKVKLDAKEEEFNKKDPQVKNRLQQRFEQQQKKISQAHPISFKRSSPKEILCDYPKQQINIEIIPPLPSNNYPNQQVSSHIHPVTFTSRKPNRNSLGYKGVYEQILSGYSTAKLLQISKKQYCNSIMNPNTKPGENLEQKAGKPKSISKNQNSRCQPQGNNMVGSLRQSSMPKQSLIDGMQRNISKLQLKHKSLQKNERGGQNRKQEGIKVYFLKNSMDPKDGHFYFNKVK